MLFVQGLWDLKKFIILFKLGRFSRIHILWDFKPLTLGIIIDIKLSFCIE